MKMDVANAEIQKLKNHLSLLREEYVKLQNKHAETERKYALLSARLGEQSEDSFVARLLSTVADLFDKELYSDMTVRLEERAFRAHRFILAARSNYWQPRSLADVEELDWTSLPHDVGFTILKWVYTDEANLDNDEAFILDLMKAASRFRLQDLINRCEQALMASVTVHNCVRFYTTADEIGAETLKQHCSKLISTHWDDFSSEDFAHMTAPLLYSMFKAKTKHPLHAAIRLKREDVVFLYLIEFNNLLPAALNELDSKGDLALSLALESKQESTADTLVKHGADVNATNGKGHTLLHTAIKSGNSFAAMFLLSQNCKIDSITPEDRDTPLHLVAASQPHLHQELVKVADTLLSRGASPNTQSVRGRTPLHYSVMVGNKEVFESLINSKMVDLEVSNMDGDVPLWFALKDLSHNFAQQLIESGASPDAVNPVTGDSLLHRVSREGLTEAGIFLIKQKAKPNPINKEGETPLHLASSEGLVELVETLLQNGGDPNAQTMKSDAVYRQTPLHLAILHNKPEVVDTILVYADGKSSDLLKLNLNLKNSDEQSPLGLSLQLSEFEVAVSLLKAGSNINSVNSQGLSLLHQAILDCDEKSAEFLINNGADVNMGTRDNDTPLELSIKMRLDNVARMLCQKGIDMRPIDSSRDPPLWVSLINNEYDIASILVRYGVDCDYWFEGPDGCFQTLLHRAIDENLEDIACFLIRSGADLDSPRRPSPSGRGGDEARDGLAPLHLCSMWGLEKVLQTLLEHGAYVNGKDAELKTPLHLAIENQNATIIALLLSHPNVDLCSRDKGGRSPFTLAMSTKNNKAAMAILDREPTVAEQFERGRNFLHSAILKNDMESVLFLLSINVNVNSPTQDSDPRTPLHLAVLGGNEMIVRNILLAGANLGDRTQTKQTSLHLAAENERSGICSILIENGVDVDALDDALNNALHVAVKVGHLATVRVLLTESQINAESVNMVGRNPLHVLAHYGKETSAAIFDLFIECMPQYPINKPDVEGNTPLLVAYMRGNGNLCRSIVNAGASLGDVNKCGVNIFCYEVATKQLLYRILDILNKEPPWVEADFCLECNAKFGITTRKHHCRHCGRVLCSKCSDKDIPILKFNLNKPVRVCMTCFDVITNGL